MSGIAVIFDRSSNPVDSAALESVMIRLNHRAINGRDMLHLGNVALGHLHFWTTPEEVGERQPVSLPDSPSTLVFDGRLDNRSEILDLLKIDPIDGKSFSDANLVLRSYARLGKQCFAFFIGEFAVVIHDRQKNELVLVRDQLGDRTLFYTYRGNQLLVASEPWAIAAKPDLDELVLVNYFAFGLPPAGKSFFQDVLEVLPAHILTINATRQDSQVYWQPDLATKLRGLSDQEYAEQFRFLLDQSVACRLRTTTPAGILMSGGLDSTAVACFAAQHSAPRPLTTVSYVFDELTDCDERQYINAMREKWGLNSIQIPCDDAWPFKNWTEWPFNPNMPEGNLYRLLKERAYNRAHTEGLNVLLTGGAGDQLYVAGKDWLADLLVEGKFKTAAEEILYSFHKWGVHWTLHSGYIQRIFRRFVDQFPGGKNIHLQGKPPVWLTDFSIKQMQSFHGKPDPALGLYENMLGLGSATGTSSEIYEASQYKLELRHPYRDLRLVQYILSIPTYQLFFRDRYKPVLRNAMKGLLPESIRTRVYPTYLINLFFRGLHNENSALSTNIMVEAPYWNKFIKSSNILKEWQKINQLDRVNPGSIVIWSCLSFDLWYQRLSN